MPRFRFFLWLLVAKAVWDPVLGHHLVLGCGGRGLGRFWYSQGLDNVL
jgi:hypothetical protein